MATLRDIQRRRRAVDNIKQITRAMYLVAAAKMRRAEDQVKAGRPYTEKLNQLLGRLAREGLVEHPLLHEREKKRTLVVVVSGDRGLAGSYNHNVHRFGQQAIREAAEHAEQVELFTMGRRARDYFRRAGIESAGAVTEVGEEISFGRAREVARDLMQRFTSGSVDEIRVVYTRFVNAMLQDVVNLQLLPIGGLQTGDEDGSETLSEDGDGAATEGDRAGRHLDLVGYIYEPSAKRVFDELLPKSVEIQLYRIMMEAKTSEHAFRMKAMKNATDNAVDLIDSLTMQFNRARQAAITTEIAEIVGGAEALRA
ncbi:MAG: ATP synthase F1 subunit gamma [Thermaerobacterales bacterium]